MEVHAGHIAVLIAAIVGLVLLGGWYVEKSVMELRMEMINDRYQCSLEIKKLLDKPAVDTKLINEMVDLKFSKFDDKITELNRRLQSQEMTSMNTTETFKRIVKDVYMDHSHHQVAKRETEDPSTDSNDQCPALKLLRGRDGRDGRDGVQGLKGDAGPHGDKGATGPPGPKGEPAGGALYVRWGHDSCPSTGAQLVYAGRVGGSHYTHTGSGANPQCLPLDPNYLNTRSGLQTSSLIYGAEYEGPVSPGVHDSEVPCAVCYVPQRSTVYMLPAKYTCPTGWTREYYGYLMAAHYTHSRSMYTCIDNSLKSVTGSIANSNGYLFYHVEGRCGSLPCPPYEETKELTCAVCTK